MNIITKSFNSNLNTQQLKTNTTFGMNKQIAEEGLKRVLPIVTGSVMAGTVLATQNGKIKNSVQKIITKEDLIAQLNIPKDAEFIYLNNTNSCNKITGVKVILSDKYIEHFERPYKSYDTLGRLVEELTEDGEYKIYDKNGNITECSYWTEGCEYGGHTYIEYNPSKGTYKKTIMDPYCRTLDEGTYIPEFPVDENAEEALPIDISKATKKSNAIVGSKNFDGTVNAPVGTDKSTLDAPTGTRLYYGAGDLRNGSYYVNPNDIDD